MFGSTLSKEAQRATGSAIIASAIAAVSLAVPAHARSLTQTQVGSFEKLPLSPAARMALALRSGRVHFSPGPAHGAAKIFPTLGCKTAPCALKNVKASGKQPFPVNETPIAADPTNSNNLITGGNDYNCTTFVAHWVSGDGGETWNGGCDALANGNTQGIADPIVGYDLSGAVYRGSIQAPYNDLAPWNIAVAKSMDNGITWGTPVIAINIHNSSSDKPWLEIDNNAGSPFKNTLYISVDQSQSDGTWRVYVTRSTDGGATWNAVAVSPKVNPPLFTGFSDLAIGADGTVYLTYTACSANGPTGDCGGTTQTIYLQKSTDGGKTWSAQIPIGTAQLAPDSEGCYYGCVPNTGIDVLDLPVIAIDNSGGAYSGRLYCVDYNWTGSFMQVQVSSSNDGGNSWSAPVPVAPPDDTHDQFYPWLSVSSTGLVGVTWLDRRNDPNNINYESYGTYSSDGGQTFATNIKMASKPSNPFNDGFGGTFMGDYSGNIWVGKKLYASWTDTRGNTAADEAGGLKK